MNLVIMFAVSQMLPCPLAHSFLKNKTSNTSPVGVNTSENQSMNNIDCSIVCYHTWTSLHVLLLIPSLGCNSGAMEERDERKKTTYDLECEE